MIPSSATPLSRRRPMIVRFLLAFLLLSVLFFGSLMIGSAVMPVSVVMGYMFHFSDSVKEHLVLHILRMPRAIATLLIGANLAVAGCMMQALTRNPLASPSVFGVNAGASFAIVMAMVLLPGLGGLPLTAAGFLGGLLTVLLVFGISAAIRGGRIEVRLALIGIVVQALFSSFTQGLLIFNEESADRILFWLAGSVAGVKWEKVSLLAIFTLAGILSAMSISRSLSLISLGDEIARGLGQRIWRIRIVGTAIVVLLAGISVAACGPIGFVGLMVPHIARYLVGHDYRVLIPFSALSGGILLTSADIASRFITFPSETPVGIVTALIGAPYFVYLARRKSRRIS